MWESLERREIDRLRPPPAGPRALDLDGEPAFATPPHPPHLPAPTLAWEF